MSTVIKNKHTGAVIRIVERPLHNVDLRYAILCEADLRSADLREADLRSADLRGADLREADLRGADLRRADLRGADLRGADLTCAILRGAILRGAILRGAILRGADLRGAILRGADLHGADLHGADLHRAVIAPGFVLTGKRPVIRIDALGSEARILSAYVTEQGMLVQTGCFTGTLDEFMKRVDATHGDSIHGQEYRAAIALIEAHARLWTPTLNKETEA